jgi:NADH-quinone oxidoreductase subunit D
MYSWRDRETVMELLEKLSGNRVNYSANLLGGVKFDVDQEQSDAIRKGLDYLEERTHHYMKVITSDETFLGRTRAVGVLTNAQAEALGAVGPTARASGVPRDVRVESPYAAYDQYPVKLVIDHRGDLEAKFVVRINELLESYRLIREILETLPAGDLTVRVPRRLPEGEAISRVEAPRGELFYFLKSNGSDKPDRIKVRTPSICNFSTVAAVVVGHNLADVPMILAGIDPCFSCNDRAVTIHRSTAQGEVWSWEDLRRYGNEFYR